jgi:gluconate 2-dehydrogenase gamma chain
MSPPTSTSRRRFIKYGAAAAIGFGVASAIEIPVIGGLISANNAAITQKNTDISQLQQQSQQYNDLSIQAISNQGLKTLSVNETVELEAILEAIIPSDGNGPGAKEAQVLVFIDHQLYGAYGNNGRMYMNGPFVLSNQTGPITQGGTTYSAGTMSVPFPGPTYQYSIPLREFWRYSLKGFEDYCKGTYGGNFEQLSQNQQIQALTDLYNNKPPNFNGIVPRDFFNELIFMTWSGFFMDPSYGGNQQMVGWKLTGFNGTNMGSFYGEGSSVTDLMVASKPTRLQPASLAQYQKTGGLIQQ